MIRNFILTACLFAMSLPSTRLAAQDRTVIPKGKPVPVVELPKIQKTKLSNGLSVWLVEHHELPLVAMNLVIQAGSDHDPLSQPGLSSMTADVLDEGTRTRDAIRISDDIEAIGADLGVSSGTDGSFVTLRSLAKHLDRALDVYADVIVNPVFPQTEFDRLKNQRLTSLIQQKDRPTSIANDAYANILYTTSHPYGTNSSGTPSSIGSMTRDDLVKFYGTYYRPNNATLIVVGDVSLGAIAAKLEKAFALWTGTDVPALTIPQPAAITARHVYLIDKPGAAQSEVRIGYPALARSTPDYFPVYVMNRMLGGQFTSRINLNLREKRGYTYGARSSFNFLKGVGPFTASSGIVTDKTDSALVQFFYEIDLMREKGMTPDELSYVKKGLIGNFALNFETPAQLAGMMQNIILYGLPDDYYSTYLQNIESVTTGDVLRVSKEYLDGSKMAVVVVGDLATIRQGIEAAALGDIIVCDTDGNPLR
ncbi:MAG TPA: pitrilysin family protein [Bacteroidota bacterium]|nr:pitrilysin family protein [Bacteroidota bacterium]